VLKRLYDVDLRKATVQLQLQTLGFLENLLPHFRGPQKETNHHPLCSCPFEGVGDLESVSLEYSLRRRIIGSVKTSHFWNPYVDSEKVVFEVHLLGVIYETGHKSGALWTVLPSLTSQRSLEVCRDMEKYRKWNRKSRTHSKFSKLTGLRVWIKGNSDRSAREAERISFRLAAKRLWHPSDTAWLDLWPQPSHARLESDMWCATPLNQLNDSSCCELKKSQTHMIQSWFEEVLRTTTCAPIDVDEEIRKGNVRSGASPFYFCGFCFLLLISAAHICHICLSWTNCHSALTDVFLSNCFSRCEGYNKMSFKMRSNMISSWKLCFPLYWL